MQQNQAVQDRAGVLAELAGPKLLGCLPRESIRLEGDADGKRAAAVLAWLKQTECASVAEREVILTAKGARIGAQLNAGFKRLAD